MIERKGQTRKITKIEEWATRIKAEQNRLHQDLEVMRRAVNATQETSHTQGQVIEEMGGKLHHLEDELENSQQEKIRNNLKFLNVREGRKKQAGKRG